MVQGEPVALLPHRHPGEIGIVAESGRVEGKIGYRRNDPAHGLAARNQLAKPVLDKDAVCRPDRVRIEAGIGYQPNLLRRAAHKMSLMSALAASLDLGAATVRLDGPRATANPGLYWRNCACTAPRRRENHRPACRRADSAQLRADGRSGQD